MSAFTDALARFRTFFNANPYNSTTNPGGFDAGGHSVLLIPYSRDLATAGEGVADLADTAVAAAATATTKASEASTSAGLAATAKTAALAAADAASASAILADGVPKGTGTTSGDLIAYSAPSTPVRLGIGGQGQVLTPISGVLGWGEAPVGGECRLTYTSATVLTLSRYKGYRIIIDNVTRAIPTAGVTLANPGVADTTYFIYAYWTGTAIALECTTTATTIVTDSRNGTIAKAGDTTRALVGMARTNSSGQWVDSSVQKFVLSWYNQTVTVVRASLASQFSTASTSPVSTGVSFEFLCWGGSLLQNAGVRALGSNSTATAAGYLFLFLDGIQSVYTIAYAPVANGGTQSFSSEYVSLGQGHHLATIRTLVSAGTETWSAGESYAFINILG